MIVLIILDKVVFSLDFLDEVLSSIRLIATGVIPVINIVINVNTRGIFNTYLESVSQVINQPPHYHMTFVSKHFWLFLMRFISAFRCSITVQNIKPKTCELKVNILFYETSTHYISGHVNTD